jgi:hypothetical protein
MPSTSLGSGIELVKRLRARPPQAPPVAGRLKRWIHRESNNSFTRSQELQSHLKKTSDLRSDLVAFVPREFLEEFLDARVTVTREHLEIGITPEVRATFPKGFLDSIQTKSQTGDLTVETLLAEAAYYDIRAHTVMNAILTPSFFKVFSKAPPDYLSALETRFGSLSNSRARATFNKVSELEAELYAESSYLYSHVVRRRFELDSEINKLETDIEALKKDKLPSAKPERQKRELEWHRDLLESEYLAALNKIAINARLLNDHIPRVQVFLSSQLAGGAPTPLGTLLRNQVSDLTGQKDVLVQKIIQGRRGDFEDEPFGLIRADPSFFRSLFYPFYKFYRFNQTFELFYPINFFGNRFRQVDLVNASGKVYRWDLKDPDSYRVFNQTVATAYSLDGLKLGEESLAKTLMDLRARGNLTTDSLKEKLKHYFTSKKSETDWGINVDPGKIYSTSLTDSMVRFTHWQGLAEAWMDKIRALENQALTSDVVKPWMEDALIQITNQTGYRRLVRDHLITAAKRKYSHPDVLSALKLHAHQMDATTRQGALTRGILKSMEKLDAAADTIDIRMIDTRIEDQIRLLSAKGVLLTHPSGFLFKAPVETQIFGEHGWRSLYGVGHALFVATPMEVWKLAGKIVGLPLTGFKGVATLSTQTLPKLLRDLVVKRGSLLKEWFQRPPAFLAKEQSLRSYLKQITENTEAAQALKLNLDHMHPQFKVMRQVWLMGGTGKLADLTMMEFLTQGQKAQKFYDVMQKVNTIGTVVKERRRIVSAIQVAKKTVTSDLAKIRSLNQKLSKGTVGDEVGGLRQIEDTFDHMVTNARRLRDIYLRHGMSTHLKPVDTLLEAVGHLQRRSSSGQETLADRLARSEGRLKGEGEMDWFSQARILVNQIGKLPDEPGHLAWVRRSPLYHPPTIRALFGDVAEFLTIKTRLAWEELLFKEGFLDRGLFRRLLRECFPHPQARARAFKDYPSPIKIQDYRREIDKVDTYFFDQQNIKDLRQTVGDIETNRVNPLGERLEHLKSIEPTPK